MDNRSFESGAAASAPSAPASPSVGYPSNGNPGGGQPATLPGEYWFHQIGEELRAIIVAAGLTPDDADLTQLLEAIVLMFGAVASTAEAQALTNNVNRITPLRLKEAFQGANQSLAASGYQKLPGGLILQWGTSGSIASNSSLDVTLPIAFPTNHLASFASRNSNVPGATGYAFWAYPKSLGQVTVFNSTATSGLCFWFAIGN